MATEHEAYDELYCETLADADPAFPLQHVVDAHAAQQADADTRPMKLAFALVGLYLHLERQFTGRQVQRAHMTLARRSRDWPTFPLPADRGAITPVQVMAATAGPDRDRAIDAWCAAVWEAYGEPRAAVAALLARHGLA